jgi:hypothetical protein
MMKSALFTGNAPRAGFAIGMRLVIAGLLLASCILSSPTASTAGLIEVLYK